MTRDILIGVLHKYKEGILSFEDLMIAVEAYLSASNGSKPLVSGSLPDDCKHEKSYYCLKTGGGRCRKCKKLTGQ